MSGPVLLIHGNPTSSELWSDVVDALDGERCITPDLPGFGGADAPEGFGFSPVEHAAVIERMVIEEDLRDVTLAVHDWGGPIGMAVAGRHPERFASFVVCNTWAWPLERRLAGVWSAWFRGPVGGRIMQRYGSDRWGAPELRAVQALADGVTGSDAFLREVELGLPRLRDKPATIVWGERDPVFGDAERRRWQAVFPKASVVTVDSGHFVPASAPAEVASAIASLS